MALAAGNLPLGMVGLFISRVLSVNMLALGGKADTRGAAIFNLLTAVLATAVALHRWLDGFPEVPRALVRTAPYRAVPEDQRGS